MTELTHSQRVDLSRAGRSITGRRFRTSHPTVLERASKETNWKKLQIKGAMLALDKILAESGMEGQRKELLLMSLTSLRIQLLEQVVTDYTYFKLHHRDTK